MRKIVTRLLGCVMVLILAFGGYVYVQNRPLPMNEHDVPILERTIALLAEERSWSKRDDRSCDPQQEKLSLYCALRGASIEVTGEFRHRSAALQEVRYTIEELNPDVDYAHRLMDYNNDRGTTFADLHALLEKSVTRLKARWQAESS